MSDKFFVTAIVVAHDGATWIPDVIAALANQSRPADRILAVDTGSIDQSATFLKRSGIKVLSVGRDVGFGSAIDQALFEYPAITSISGDEAALEEWLWFIHDDCAPAHDALENLLEAVADRPNVAIAGPKLRGWYDRNHLLEVGITIAGNGARWTGLERREQDQGQHDGNNNEVLSVSTAAMLAKRSVFEDIGGFDPNLELFRDDVDLGWRTHVAGFSAICVTSALAFHAEAAANERRTVDVSEAFLHRPLLLDRRNAAYVLLANSSWWILPWLALQLVVSSGFRALVNLLAKLPGYAGDELAAVVLLLVKPADLIQGRRLRRHNRMISARAVTRFIPPRSQQFRATFERMSNLLLHDFKPNSDFEEPQISQSYSDIGLIEEGFDDPELLVSKPRRSLRNLKSRPLLVAIAFMVVITAVASRSRYGAISGGALPVSPLGARDLISKYFESWHLVGLGSSASSPTWLALLGVASAVTLGNFPLFISVFFWLVPPLAFFIAYRSMKRLSIKPRTAILGGVVYALSPVVWSSINQGRIGTLALILLGPILISLVPLRIEIADSSWRKIYATSLLVSALAAFSATFLLFWSLINLWLIIVSVIKVWKLSSDSELKSWLSKIIFLFTPTVKRRLAFLILPWLATFPWSAIMLLHPTSFLLEPGLPLSSATRWSVMLLNPGGLSGTPIWLVAPSLLFIIIALLTPVHRNWGAASAGLLAAAIALSSVIISGHGSSANVWVGPLLVFAEFLALIPILKTADELIPNLRDSSFGFGHIVSALVSVVTIISLVGSIFWVVSAGSNSLVKSGQTQVIPAFVASLAETDAKPKTLVLRKSHGSVQYFISRGSDLELGDPDVVVAPSNEVQSAIADLVSGAGATTSKLIGEVGIQYLFMQNPIDQILVRTIDGQGGFTRSSATKDGIIWRVVGSSTRLIFTSLHGDKVSLASNDVGANVKVPGTGIITLAEKFDTKWHLLLNGMPVPVIQSPSGLPTFAVVSSGDVSLSHDGTLRRGLLSIQFISLLVIGVLALPAGRRRKEVPIEELV
ncbi:MAG: glycosyltransferase [Actinomycetes bacterium]